MSGRRNKSTQGFPPDVNRSLTWANWDEGLLSLELQELNELDFDLSLTGFDPGAETKKFCIRHKADRITLLPRPYY